MLFTYWCTGGSALSLSGAVFSLGAMQIAFSRKQTFSPFPTPRSISCSVHSIVFHELICRLFLPHVHLLCHCIVFRPSVESIHATLDSNSDMQCPWALARDGYMNSI